ncbi:MAG: hypothetical protein KatS3mg068_2666 [Candidatus Sericytochromatia bacterium]|nr:MAG: hypothetical protein KatS3mg068_2666 [Candidatus Sericytochromatia bacterium]
MKFLTLSQVYERFKDNLKSNLNFDLNTAVYQIYDYYLFKNNNKYYIYFENNEKKVQKFLFIIDEKNSQYLDTLLNEKAINEKELYEFIKKELFNFDYNIDEFSDLETLKFALNNKKSVRVQGDLCIKCLYNSAELLQLSSDKFNKLIDDLNNDAKNINLDNHHLYFSIFNNDPLFIDKLILNDKKVFKDLLEVEGIVDKNYIDNNNISEDQIIEKIDDDTYKIKTNIDLFIKYSTFRIGVRGIDEILELRFFNFDKCYLYFVHREHDPIKIILDDGIYAIYNVTFYNNLLEN